MPLGEGRHTFRSPFVAEHRGRQQSSIDQELGVGLALSDDDRAAWACAHDCRPVKGHAAITGAEDIFSVHLAVSEEPLARSLLGRRDPLHQLVAVLPIEQRLVRERVVEYLRELIVLPAQERIVEWFTGMLLGVGILLGFSLRAARLPSTVSAAAAVGGKASAVVGLAGVAAETIALSVAAR